ncbi:LysE family translocator [Candidatus Puniceispirillum marinum]|uniref:Transporter, LysE family n=1 Tax=Puniceispirillum marinum (strain IMCC1322) TaxID=488538 RepID=D5BP47_PUNMI|nr:LysE family translocator [Candidatus Puniceispirillum marinum]ADE40481.1 transporter, LysE family [Candidatus Puniceispirillum marinum IMCC1322]
MNEQLLHITSMAFFALVTSITPGPVNIVLAMSGAQFGIRKSQLYILGATIAFTGLLLCLGMGLGAVISAYPVITNSIKIVGTAYLFYLAYRIISSGNNYAHDHHDSPPLGFIDGALTQLANPKAWSVSLSANSIYVVAHEPVIVTLMTFAILFFVICYGSLWLWAAFGSRVALLPPAYVGALHWILGICLILSIGLMWL